MANFGRLRQKTRKIYHSGRSNDLISQVPQIQRSYARDMPVSFMRIFLIRMITMTHQRCTYQELAEQWSITVPAAKQRVRRAGWKRGRGNDGVVRVLVPEDTERMETTVSSIKASENQTLVTLRDTVENLTSVTIKQAQRIEDLTTMLLDNQEQNAVLRERIAALESPKITPFVVPSSSQSSSSQPRSLSIIKRVIRVLYNGDT